MRVQMSLSKEGRQILHKEQRENFEKEGTKITYGFIAGKSIKSIFEEREIIDWFRVMKYSIETGEGEGAEEFSTILNLETSVRQEIVVLQVYLKKYFAAARVHAAFVVKLSLKAHEMKKNGINIYI